MTKGNFNPAALVTMLSGDMQNASVAMTPGGIETQEELGNVQLREECWFPKNIMHSPKSHADLEKEWGVKFEDKGNDIFYDVLLPEGWSIKPSKGNPHYWSNVVDANGMIRASIFYKAAFYDRSSHAFIEDGAKKYEEQDDVEK